MKKKVLLIEPYYAGSHKVLIDLLCSLFDSCSEGEDAPEVHLATMTGKKWHWRARTSALHFAQTIPIAQDFVYETIFASCVLPLHELLALRPDLVNGKKILYFHENQLVYPRRKIKDRDFQYGYNQIMSCLVADVVLFNSNFNKDSFLSSMKSFFKLQPDYRPKNLRESIEPKCRVLYFPIDFTKIENIMPREDPSWNEIRIVWPHRWEYDKNPEMFFNTMVRLVGEGITNFRLSVLGENFADNPPIFDEAKTLLKDYIIHFGYLNSKDEYYQVLRQSDIVISTADHEFFGVAMVEATFCGCFPLCPNSLVYPEIFSSCPGSLFKSADDLYLILKKVLADPITFRKNSKTASVIDFNKFDWATLKLNFAQELLLDDLG
ncbi:unnamed protein product [Allacma fusca]|uniref:tRNA-queuosine alpha-mannosyltransferase n=1 Tax=Allacma fusca TaxID=39272 RepID=A0A8J2PQE9_9HEXA|nr:unnamed protein product [Allacma fusca]